MDYCKCSKEGEIATLITEVREIKSSQTETKDLVIIVTRLVEQFNVTQKDVRVIKDDLQVLKDKPMGVVSRIIYMVLGVLITILVNKIMGAF